MEDTEPYVITPYETWLLDEDVYRSACPVMAHLLGCTVTTHKVREYLGVRKKSTIIVPPWGMLVWWTSPKVRSHDDLLIHARTVLSGEIHTFTPDQIVFWFPGWDA
jgi:hypothetical protein